MLDSAHTPRHTVTDITAHGFMHGLPLEVTQPGGPDTPTGWCRSTYPALVCGCGGFRLTWAYQPPATPDQGTLYAYAHGRVFVHAAHPADGSGTVCTTEAPAPVCDCGQYTMQWD